MRSLSTPKKNLGIGLKPEIVPKNEKNPKPDSRDLIYKVDAEKRARGGGLNSQNAPDLEIWRICAVHCTSAVYCTFTKHSNGASGDVGDQLDLGRAGMDIVDSWGKKRCREGAGRMPRGSAGLDARNEFSRQFRVTFKKQS